MASKGTQARRTTLAILAAAAVASCGPVAGGARTVGSSQASMALAGRGSPAGFVAAVARSIRLAPHGLAVFSSSDGRLLRWLVRGAPDPIPVSVSPDGRWLYYYDQGTLTRGRCPNTGFADPVLWKVPTGGGRPERAGIRTPSIAFSPDGRMVAWTASSRCGRVVRIVVRNRRTGATRRIILAHNDLGGQPTFSAQLSWAPDDTHLAVAVAPAAAINALSVIDALRARSAITARSIPPCAGENSGCLDPAFDVRGQLTFLKWRDTLSECHRGGCRRSSFGESVMRWQRGQAEQLFRLPGLQDGSATIAVNRTGNAVLLETATHSPEIWRWNRGRLSLILRSTPSRVVLSPLWLPRKR